MYDLPDHQWRLLRGGVHLHVLRPDLEAGVPEEVQDPVRYQRAPGVEQIHRSHEATHLESG